MDTIFCTLFDINYIDKGLTLFDSMRRHMNEFKLYVFAFDDKCYEILKKVNHKSLIPISMEEFETPDLLRVKEERTRAEYCWTCSPWIIKHVLEKYNEPICTYIDADMFFFSSPQSVFDEMREKNDSVIIVPHRFRSIEEEREAHDKVGSYCVEFNTFVNDASGKEALDWWADRCLEWCYYAIPGTTEWYGDQKYLNVFPEKFEGVMICDHFGVGLAPWNIDLVSFEVEESGVPYVKVKKSGKVYPVVIYHFENVAFISKHILHTSSRTSSDDLYNAVYKRYILRLLRIRALIENKFKIRITRERRVVTKNPLMAFYQKRISPIRRVKHLRDLIWVK